MNDGDPQSSFSRLEKLLAENNSRLKNIQFTLRTISFWLMLIFVVLIIEYGDDVRAALREYSAAAQLELHPSDICNEKCRGCTYGHDDPTIKPPAICFPFSG